MKEGGEKDRSSVPFKEVYPLSHRNAHTPKAHLSTSDLMKTAIKRRKEKGQARPICSHTCSSTRLVQTHVGCTVNQQHITDSWYTWRRDVSVYHDRTPLNWSKVCYVWSCRRIVWLMQLACLAQALGSFVGFSQCKVSSVGFQEHTKCWKLQHKKTCTRTTFHIVILLFLLITAGMRGLWTYCQGEWLALIHTIINPAHACWCLRHCTIGYFIFCTVLIPYLKCYL